MGCKHVLYRYWIIPFSTCWRWGYNNYAMLTKDFESALFGFGLPPAVKTIASWVCPLLQLLQPRTHCCYSKHFTSKNNNDNNNSSHDDDDDDDDSNYCDTNARVAGDPNLISSYLSPISFCICSKLINFVNFFRARSLSSFSRYQISIMYCITFDFHSSWPMKSCSMQTETLQSVLWLAHCLQVQRTLSIHLVSPDSEW